MDTVSTVAKMFLLFTCIAFSSIDIRVNHQITVTGKSLSDAYHKSKEELSTTEYLSEVEILNGEFDFDNNAREESKYIQNFSIYRDVVVESIEKLSDFFIELENVERIEMESTSSMVFRWNPNLTSISFENSLGLILIYLKVVQIQSLSLHQP